MKFLLWGGFVVFVLIIGSQFFVSLRLAELRRSGQYPKKGEATMADVERLLKRGSHILALRCYREIHGCSHRKARSALGALVGKQE